MNSDLFFPVVSTIAVLLSISSLCTSIIKYLILFKIQKGETKNIRVLKEQLSELKAMQDSLEIGLSKKDDQAQSEETEKLINEIRVQLKQYQDKIEENAQD